MKRVRDLVVVIALFVVVAMMVVAATEASPSCPGIADPPPPTGTAAPGAPNVVLILSDDQRFDSMNSMPNVQALLGGHGVTFPNAYVTTPVCCPSRSSILTGQYSRHTGVFQNFGEHGGASAFSDGSTLATWLHSSGYHTALVGKYLNDYEALPACYIPPGWDTWDAIVGEAADHYYNATITENGREVTYGAGPSDYQTTVLTGLATEWIAKTPAPFFLYFAPSSPHRPAIPAPGDVGAYDGIQPFRPPSFNEPDTSDKPWDGQIAPMTAADIGVADRMNEHQREALISLDEDVAKIVDALKQRGVLDNTVIIYMSDNGWLLGEHRLLSKTWPYEESIKVPMVWRLPWADAARSNPAQVLNIDLAPTIAELAGAEPGPVDGTSLVPMLRWDAATWDPSSGPPPGTGRSDFVIEWLGIDLSAVEGPPPYEGVHSQRYVYVEYANGWRELYDLQTDPEQLNNLAGIAAYSELQAKLTARLKELLAEQPHRAPAPQPAVPPDATPPAALP